MFGITGSPSTRSSITVRAKLSRITSTTFGREVVSTRRAGVSAPGAFPRSAAKRSVSCGSS